MVPYPRAAVAADAAIGDVEFVITLVSELWRYQLPAVVTRLPEVSFGVIRTEFAEADVERTKLGTAIEAEDAVPAKVSVFVAQVGIDVVLTEMVAGPVRPSFQTVTVSLNFARTTLDFVPLLIDTWPAPAMLTVTDSGVRVLVEPAEFCCSQVK